MDYSVIHCVFLFDIQTESYRNDAISNALDHLLFFAHLEHFFVWLKCACLPRSDTRCARGK
ncbi:MAG: hypothetical protein EBY29_09530 [Planctomycetes bacterium]|nr:hypothetical protein [Planctomycetota bacterium]